MLATLDFACPIAWKSAKQGCSSSYSNAGFPSPTPRSTLHSSQCHQGQQQQSEESINDDKEWLQRRYYETLWLGEEHSPLVGFLQHLSRYERQSDDASQLIPTFAGLLKSRQQIRRRFSAAAAFGLKGPDALELVIKGLCNDDGDEEGGTIEREIVRMALDSGPGSLITAELRNNADKGKDAKVTRAWLRAIESRELQVQVLLILTLLRLSTRAPTLPPIAISKTSFRTAPEREADSKEAVELRTPLVSTQPDVSGQSAAATSITKRKRKADNAKRWTGGKGLSAFPWTLQRQSSRDDSNCTRNDEENDISPESLSKRFEALLDSLCLQVLTSDISLNNSQDDKDTSPLSKDNTSKGKAAVDVMHPWQLFGSNGRKRQQSRGDKDTMQWLCCHIIEPYFSKMLPRQCGIARGKCFVPGSGSTPAKLGRREVDAAKLHLHKLPARSSIAIHRDEQRAREMKESRHSRSPSPAISVKALPQEETARMQKPLRVASSLSGKWDARTVSVRRKWDRSQSTGATTREIPAFERSNSVQPIVRKLEASAKDSKSRQSQTLVMDTPQKGTNMRSSNFSSQSQLQPRSTSSSAASLAVWRRTESQPVLTAPIRKQLSEAKDNDDEDIDDTSVSIADSLFFEDSGDENEDGNEPNRSPSRLPTITTLDRTILARTESQPILTTPYSDEEGDKEGDEEGDEEGDSSDELRPIMITKKRKTIVTSLSFAGKEVAAARNPFAVSH